MLNLHSLRVPLGLAVAVALTACAASAGKSTSPTAAAAAPTAASAQSGCAPAGVHKIQGGVLRTPPGAHAGATPLLIVVIPGGGGDRNDRLGVGKAADKIGFGVLYPTSLHGGFWTLNDQQGTQDVTDVTGLLDRVAATGCFDHDRISITGVSNGAGFAARMSCKLPTRFAAVVPVAAGYRALDPCPANARMSFLDIHGTADTVVPYNGKKPDRAGSVPKYTARRAAIDGCAATPRKTIPRRLVQRFTWHGCGSGLRVERLRLSGTDHGWPGAGPPLPDHNPSGLNATTEVLRFVATARRQSG